MFPVLFAVVATLPWLLALSLLVDDEGGGGGIVLRACDVSGMIIFSHDFDYFL